MGRIKSKLSSKKNSEKEARGRELARERAKRFRERLKSNPEKLEEVREADRVRRRKNYRIEKEEREKDPVYRETCRAIWRQEKQKTKEVTWTDFIENLPINVKSQRRRRSLERRNMLLAKQKVEADNKMLKRKVKVLQTLIARKRRATAPSNTVETELPRLKKENNKKKLSAKIKCNKRKRDLAIKFKRGKYIVWQYKAEMFMARDYISKALPGSTMLDPRKMNKLRKFRQKKGCVVTKRVLRLKMRDLYKEFTAVYPEFPYKFSTFSKMRPKYIVTAKKGTQKQKCICVIHSNLERKLNAMNKFCQTFHKHDLQLRTVDELSDKTLCEYSGSYAHLECLERRCKSCSADKIMDHYVEVLGDINIQKETVSWTKWTTVTQYLI